MRNFLAGIIACLLGVPILASNPYMIPAKDSFVLMVHGIDSNRYTWYTANNLGEPDLLKGPSDQWFHYLNKDLKLSEKQLFAYSFSSKSGYHGENMLELGAAGFRSRAGDPSAQNNNLQMKSSTGKEIVGNTGIVGTRTWLEQVREEYKQTLFGDSQINKEDLITKKKVWDDIKDVPDALIPPKLILMAHSQGNFAVRGYIQSGNLLRESNIFQRISDEMPDRLPETLLKKYEANPLGFYEYPVEKVVFINPVLRGGEIETFLMIRALRSLQTLLNIKALNAIAIDGVSSKQILELQVNTLLAAVAVDDKFLTQSATQPLVRWLMEPIVYFVIGKDVPLLAGEQKCTRAELIVKISNLSQDSVVFIAQQLLGGKKKIEVPGKDFWSLVGDAVKDAKDKTLSVLNDGVNVVFAPLNVMERLKSLSELVKNDNLFPAQSYLKGFVHVVNTLSPHLNPIVLGPKLDVGAVNAFSPSVGDLYHVGPGGTEEVLRKLMLDSAIHQLPGDYDENKRKWQPKYRMVNSSGGIAPNGVMTRAALALEMVDSLSEAIPRVGMNELDESETNKEAIKNKPGLIPKIEIPELGGYQPLKNPYMTMTFASPEFWRFNWNQKFYSLMASNVGGVFTNQGDIVVTDSSLLGEGVAELKRNSAKAYFRSNPLSLANDLEDAFLVSFGLDSAIIAAEVFSGGSIPSEVKGWMRAAVYEYYLWRVYERAYSTILGGDKRFSNPYTELAKHLSVMDHAVSEGHWQDMDKSLYETPEIIIDGAYQLVDSATAKEKYGFEQATPTEGRVVVISEVGKPATVLRGIRPETNWAGAKMLWPSYAVVRGSPTVNEVIAGFSELKDGSVEKRFYQRVSTFDISDTQANEAVAIAHADLKYPQKTAALTLTGDEIVLRGSLMD
jgi:hypothetical protein